MMPLQVRHATDAVSLDFERLRAWAPTLDDEHFSAALSALGALLAESGAVRSQDVRRVIPQAEIAGRLRSLFKPRTERARVPWTIAPLVGKAGELTSLDGLGLDPNVLAHAWTAVVKASRVWNRQAVATLEMDPARFDLATLAGLAAWLGPIGSDTGAFVVERGLGANGHFQWPMRIAVVPGTEAAAFRGRLHGFAAAQHQWVNNLVEFIEPQGPHDACELLLAPWPLDEAIDRLDRVPHGIDAACLIVLGGPGRAASMTAEGLRGALEASVDPWAVGVVDVSGADLGAWFTELVRQLSHDLTLEHALRLAPQSRIAPLIVADPDALRRMGVRQAAYRSLGALPVLGRSSVNLPTLPGLSVGAGVHPRSFVIQAIRRDGAFDFEDTGAKGTSALHRYVEAELDFAARPMSRAKPPRAALLADEAVADVRRPVRRAARMQPRPPRPAKLERRYLQGQLLRRQARGGEERVIGHLEPLTRYLLDVRIGAPDPEWTRADRPVPPEAIPPDQERNRLRIVFDPGGREKPQTAMIELPATGSSTTCRFGFRSGADGGMQGRLSVLFRNRVLQTALVTTGEKGLRIEIDGVVRPGLVALSPRRAFDLAFVHNHDGNGSSRVTAMSGGWVAKVPPRQLDRSVDAIRKLLTDAATNARTHTGLTSKATVALLFKLARHGHTLRTLVVPEDDPRGLGDPERARYVQVVSADPSAIFPAELFYDFPPPSSPVLCSNAEKALAAGRCDAAKFHGQPAADDTLSVVCPAGFWAMNRVIERYASPRDVIKDLVGYDFGVRSEPVGRRDRLGGLSDALFAWSDLVEKADAQKVADALAAATKGKAREVDNWPAWIKAIKAEGPGLLVLLSHTDQDKDLIETALIIAKNEKCLFNSFDRPYVREAKLPDNSIDTRPGPLVFLLGCDTARAWSEYQSFVVLFREKHAALVVGTVGSVAARHAPNVAAKLVEELAARTAGGAGTQAEAFGDVLLSARRKLLKEGEVMALALTSYGDADWKFG